ncbi:MAG: Sel1 [Rickettsiaceae bacterium]|jgi:TPR repeat protein|nr:Sel1 [Rickettsiaceae bacterium]
MPNNYITYQRNLDKIRKLSASLLEDSKDGDVNELNIASNIIQTVILEIRPFEESIDKNTSLIMLREVVRKCPEIFKEARDNIEKIAKDGSNPNQAESSYIIGWLHYEGIIFPHRDRKKAAINYLTIAEEQNYAPARHLLAICYDYAQNDAAKDKGKELLELSAAQGYAASQCKLAQTCNYLFSKEGAKVKELFELSANQGYAMSQYELVRLHENSPISPDESKIAELCELAAQQGLSSAQSNLASRYFYGNGVKKNLVTALKWKYKSGRSDDEFTKSIKAELKKQNAIMTSAIIQELGDDFYQAHKNRIDEVLQQFETEEYYLNPEEFALGSKKLREFNETLKSSLLPIEIDANMASRRLLNPKEIAEILAWKHLSTLTSREQNNMVLNSMTLELAYKNATGEDLPEELFEITATLLGASSDQVQEVSDKSFNLQKKLTAKAVTDSREESKESPSLPENHIPKRANTVPSPSMYSRHTTWFNLTTTQLQFGEFVYDESPNGSLSLRFRQEGLFEQFCYDEHNDKLLGRFEESGVKIERRGNQLDIVLTPDQNPEVITIFNEIKANLKTKELQVPKIQTLPGMRMER